MVVDAKRQELVARVGLRTSDTIAHALSRSSRLFHERALAEVRAAGFPEVKQRWIALLPHLSGEGIRSSELSERLEITRQGTGQLIGELEGFGYVERVPDPTDGRAKLVRLTDRGWAAWLAGLEALRSLEAELETALGRPALQALRQHVPRLLAALEGLED